MKLKLFLFSMLISLWSIGATHNVTVDDNSFTPSALTINEGDTVIWTNVGGSHNVNGTTVTFPSNPASFGNSVGSGWTYQFVFDVAGSYDYQCDPHAGMGMTGTVTVLSVSVPCSKPFFSEYIEGSGNNKGFEIYNPTAGSLDLAPYKVYMSVNGGTTVNDLNLTGTLASGDVYIVTTDEADAGVQSVADAVLSFPSVAHYNGDDALFLVDTVNNDTLDIIGVIGVDPGSSWTVGTGSTANHTLVRNMSVSAGQKDWSVGATEWMVYPENTFIYLGAHSSSCAAAANSLVNFSVSSLTVDEAVGSVDVNIFINPTSSTNDTITLQASLGANVTVPGDGSIVPVPDISTGLFKLPVPANEDTVNFTISVVDDAVIEGNETLFVNMYSVTSGLTMGAVTDFTFVVEDNDAPAPAIPTYTIDEISSVDADGIADSVDVYCRLHGVVFSDDFDGNAGLSFYIYDGTGGINVFNFDDVDNYVVNRGDSISVVGELTMYNGLLELLVDSINVLGTGKTLQDPVLITDLNESTESELVRMNGVWLLDPSQWPTSTSNTNVDFTNGTDTFLIRIHGSTGIYMSSAPGGRFDIIGVGNQFDSSIPHDEGYQIFPRDSNDIIEVDVPMLSITEIMPSSAQPSPIDGDWFEVTNNGSTAVDMMGFSWDDESREVGKHTITVSVTIDAGESVIFLDAETPDDVAWTDSWMQTNNNIKVLNTSDEFEDFSGFSSGGDEVNLYDDGGRLLSRVAYTGADVSAGVSIQVDGDTVTGPSQDGVDGAYTSNDGDIGNPGNMTVGINEFLLNNINLYPNPSTGKFFIETDNSEEKSIRIMSVTGNIVDEFTTKDRFIEISTTSMSRGVYLVSIEAGRNQATRKLIVK